jgi:hypothetical protein
MLKERISHSEVWESSLQDFTKLAQLRNVFYLKLDKIVIIKLKWNAQDKGLFLKGILFSHSHVLVGIEGYGIVCRTIDIKRDSRVCNLIVLFGEISNPCILGIIFLGSSLDFIHVRL